MLNFTPTAEDGLPHEALRAAGPLGRALPGFPSIDLGGWRARAFLRAGLDDLLMADVFALKLSP
jgi:hypothetical protein